ncbi:MAG TPA: ABC transporter substrate-binding protein [Stellaceae bacterium]|nr:ABC transporter substrate-binding protein [Stellaceae bacterium]
MKRRAFIAVVGGAVAWPLTVGAQQTTNPVIGFLNGASPKGYATYLASFQQGLKETGYSEGDNVAIEYRWAEGQYDRLPGLAADLVRRHVAVIVANSTAAPAAVAATKTIPIVFLSGLDPIRAGLVANLNHPGANVTGVSLFSNDLAAKHLGLLRELAPAATSIALLVNPSNPAAPFYVSDTQRAAQTIGRHIHVVNASTPLEIDAGFATLPQLGAGALVIVADTFFIDHRDQIVALAARYNIPALYPFPSFATAGGLMSYGTSLTDLYRQVGVYTGKVLKGAKPADLPVLQPTKFELVINLKTAKALGLELSPNLLAQADEVIE